MLASRGDSKTARMTIAEGHGDVLVHTRRPTTATPTAVSTMWRGRRNQSTMARAMRLTAPGYRSCGILNPDMPGCGGCDGGVGLSTHVAVARRRILDACDGG